MLYSPSYDLLEAVSYNGSPGTVVDIQFSLDEDTGYVSESYGVSFDDGTYIMYIDPLDLTVQTSADGFTS